MKIDINCDIGEIEANLQKDFKLLKYVSSINLACGCHAGNYLLMDALIDAAIDRGIAIGAHPGYLDKENFGRSKMSLSDQALTALITYQVGALKTMVESKGHRLHHVKLHGALYNLATTDSRTAEVVAKAIAEIDENLIVFGMFNSVLETACKHYDLVYKNEFFADRYYDHYRLAARTEGGVIKDLQKILHQCHDMLNLGRVEDIHGKIHPIKGDTICVHGDHENSLEVLKALDQSLKSSGFETTWR